jgi:hypothetical protein
MLPSATGQNILKQECGKHSNPKFIEIIAKLRDPSLNADFMEKSIIRPEVIKSPKTTKIDQKIIDGHLKKNEKDNEGCPLLPIHRQE